MKSIISLTLFTCLLATIVFPCFAQENEAAQTVMNTVIKIEETAICLDVVDREPVGAGDVFSTDITKLMCFTRVTGSEENTEIFHNWYFGDKMVASIPLRIGSINWRTYSSKKIIPDHAGEWKVEILSQDEKLLKRIYFIIE